VSPKNLIELIRDEELLNEKGGFVPKRLIKHRNPKFKGEVENASIQSPKTSHERRKESLKRNAFGDFSSSEGEGN
jgi:hypothetical protein